MKLVKPVLKYAKSWWDANQEFYNEGKKEFEKEGDDLLYNAKKYIRECKDIAVGKNLPIGYVPSSTYWLIDDDKFIGRVSVRHKLNADLEKIGGHIGYAIRPTERKKGYGSKALKFVLPKAKELGIKKALITCNDSNIASKKIIEKNGGILWDKIEVDGDLIRRYWMIID